MATHIVRRGSIVTVMKQAGHSNGTTTHNEHINGPILFNKKGPHTKKRIPSNCTSESKKIGDPTVSQGLSRNAKL